MAEYDYWMETIREAFEDAGIMGASDDQIGTVASWAEGAYENEGLATGRDCIPDPRDEKIARLEKELQDERDKVTCPECGGTGVIISYGPVHSSWSQCWTCRGVGRCSPNRRN